VNSKVKDLRLLLPVSREAVLYTCIILEELRKTIKPKVEESS
jgi:hypothetical protein